MKRLRLRKWAKWACTIAAFGFGGAAIFSSIYCCRWTSLSRDGLTMRFTQIGDGALRVMLIRNANPYGTQWPVDAAFSFERSPGWAWGPWTWKAGPAGERMFHPGFQYWCMQNTCEMGVNLLYPVFLTSIPTALLWYADRRPSRHGVCVRCGYDRYGLDPQAPCPQSA